MIFEAIIIVVLMTIASAVSAITGFGTSTISIPLLLFFFPLPQVLLFVGIIRWFVTIWKMILFHTGFRWEIILGFGLPAAFASFLGAQALLYYADYLSMHVIGVFLLSYVAFIIIRPHFKLAKWPGVMVSGGALSGFSAGIFGISGPIQTAFLSAFDLPKMMLIFTVATTEFFIDTVRLGTYLLGGMHLIPLLFLALILSIPAVFFGAWGAKRVLHGIPQQYFRFVVLLFLGIVGLRWALWG